MREFEVIGEYGPKEYDAQVHSLIAAPEGKDFKQGDIVTINDGTLCYGILDYDPTDSTYLCSCLEGRRWFSKLYMTKEVK